MAREEDNIRKHIDFIKAFAIFGVFTYHFGFDTLRDKSSIYTLADNLAAFRHAGGLKDMYWDAMYSLFSLGQATSFLFIISSGFGLSYSYLTRRVSWGEFYIKRALRILPLYWISLIITYILYTTSLSSIFNIPLADRSKSLVIHLFLLQDFTSHYIDFGALWFVGYIAMFYVLFPLVILAVNSTNRWLFLLASFALIVPVEYTIASTGFEHVRAIPFRHLPLFMYGTIIAYYAHRMPERLHGLLCRPAYQICFAVMFAICVHGLGVYASEVGIVSLLLFNVLFISLFNLLYPAGVLFLKSSYLKSLLAFIAVASYLVFLLHMPLLRALIYLTDIRKVIDIDYIFPVMLALFMLISAPMYFVQRIYDKMIKDRFLYKHKSSAV